MCLIVPGKIIEIEKDITTIDYGSEQRKAKLIDLNYNIRDYVLVKAKIVVEKVSEEQFQGWLEVLNSEEI